jgi:hypothetical protein
LRFFRCQGCSLILKDPTVRATPSQERAHYLKHNNDLADAGYREHLLKVVGPLVLRLPPSAVGLDYGCGPVLSVEPLMRERGFRCHSYDPIFSPRPELLTENTYNYIACCEVAEHFQHPREEFFRLHALLRPGGVLALMTRLPPDTFDTWWYQRDPTHVVFYSERTFAWIAGHVGFEILERRGDLVLMGKIGGEVESSRSFQGSIPS